MHSAGPGVTRAAAERGERKQWGPGDVCACWRGGWQLPCEEFYYGLFRAYEHYLPLRRDLGRAPPSPLSSCA